MRAMRGAGGRYDDFRRRVVGLYALALMEKEGPVHGYLLSEAISQRTGGSWRPGPGSVYPSLNQLVQSGLARRTPAKRRQNYTITRKGREMLGAVRSRAGFFERGKPDVSLLWVDIVGYQGVEAFLVERLRRALASVEECVRNSPGAGSDPGGLRRTVLEELGRATGRLEESPASPRPRARRRAEEGGR